MKSTARFPLRSSSPLREASVVITGASSGIGRATAREFARHGARLVLAARNVAALQEVAGECAMAGSHAIVVPTDVSDAAQVDELTRRAIDAYGRIDVWINNAGVGLFGPFANAGIDEHRRVIEVDLLGAVNSAAAVVPHFLSRKRGTMITNISIGGFVPVPFASAYTAAKFGLRGFMASLRQELAEEGDIHVCSVFPGVIDTPGYQHGGNVSGVALKPAPFADRPERVAKAIVAVALRPRAEVPVGLASRAARLGYGIAPSITERITGRFFRAYLKHGEPAPMEEGNLHAPSHGRMSPSGGWKRNHPASKLPRPWVWLGVAGITAAAFAISRRDRIPSHRADRPVPRVPDVEREPVPPGTLVRP